MSGPERVKRILIVDDEPDVVSYLEMLLRDEGYETTSAVDGEEALEAVRRDPPDLVSLDISMPKASGTRFYKELRSDPALAKVRVVIVTAVTGLGGDTHAYERFISGRNIVPPPDAFFPKPIEAEEFLATVRTLLGKPADHAVAGT
ncbi:MAG TPA: response regulator [Longimicrobiales bacterium]|jgi:CheY-like chemotaxis protein